MEKRVGIIGGSGLYHIEGIENLRRERITTPFGDPSDKLDMGRLNGKEVVFLARHGHGHKLLPTEINYRANIWAMKKLGVEWIISVSAVGSFRKEMKPTDVVLIDQFFDRTNQARPSTFFGNGIAAHVMFAHPICPDLSRIIYESGQEEGEGNRMHWGGTYVNMEGPAFSTKAESKLYKSWGMDVIGMTNLQEAKLAREAEICYATMAMVTDYDCWIEDDPNAEIVNVELIIQYLKKNAEVAKKIISKTISMIPDDRHCDCAMALKSAMITRSEIVPKETLEKLDLLLGKYLKK